MSVLEAVPERQHSGTPRQHKHYLDGAYHIIRNAADELGFAHLSEIMQVKENTMRTIVGPHGQKRPADVAANAVHVGKLLVGDIEETYVEREPIWSRLRLRVYWVSIGATQEHPSEGILWHEVLAREGVPWNQRVRGYVRKTAEGWVLRPAGFFNAERKLYLSLEDAVKAILNNEMWQGSSSGKKILLLSGKRLFGTLRLSTRLFSQE